MDQGSRRATDEEVDTWKTDGWVLIEGLVGTEEIDGVLEDVYQSVPSNDDYHRDPEGETDRRRGRPVRPPEAFVWPDGGPGFRPQQQAWADIFPFRGSGALNRLCVAPFGGRLRGACPGDSRYPALPDSSLGQIRRAHQLRTAHAHGPQPLMVTGTRHAAMVEP